MTINKKHQRSKILDSKKVLFSGNCPECNCDDLEQIDGMFTDYQELKCSNSHVFTIWSLGWEVKDGI